MESYHKGLYRSSNQAIIGGVAAGIAEHLKTDPTLIRIIFAIIALFGGGGVLIYLILWIVLPSYETSHFEVPKNPNIKQDKESKETNKSNYSKPDHSNTGGLIVGISLITIGLIFLADRFLPRIHFLDFWPLILLIIGIVLIITGIKKPKTD